MEEFARLHDESTVLRFSHRPEKHKLADPTITDSLGRTLKIEPLDVVYESRLARMLGNEATSNPTYMMGFVLPAASVFEIDGVALAKPTTVQELEDSIARLGREGIAAFMQHVQSEFAQVEQAMKAAKSD